MAALEQLRETLNLESLPLRIECFDISNTQGREIVASMAVFVDGQPKTSLYRSFAVRGLDGQDDFASMAQVVGRRFARLRDGDGDPSFGSVPNLVVIDGGKGQLLGGARRDHAHLRALGKQHVDNRIHKRRQSSIVLNSAPWLCSGCHQSHAMRSIGEAFCIIQSRAARASLQLRRSAPCFSNQP